MTSIGYFEWRVRWIKQSNDWRNQGHIHLERKRAIIHKMLCRRSIHHNHLLPRIINPFRSLILDGVRFSRWICCSWIYYEETQIDCEEETIEVSEEKWRALPLPLHFLSYSDMCLSYPRRTKDWFIPFRALSIAPPHSPDIPHQRSVSVPAYYNTGTNQSHWIASIVSDSNWILSQRIVPSIPQLIDLLIYTSIRILDLRLLSLVKVSGILHDQWSERFKSKTITNNSVDEPCLCPPSVPDSTTPLLAVPKTSRALSMSRESVVMFDMVSHSMGWRV